MCTTSLLGTLIKSIAIQNNNPDISPILMKMIKRLSERCGFKSMAILEAVVGVVLCLY